jgi:lantibiotic modifying enzyme
VDQYAVAGAEPPASSGPELWFEQPVAAIAGPWEEELAARIEGISALTAQERDVIRLAGVSALRLTLHVKLARVFLIELHALRLGRGLPVGAPERGRTGAARDDTRLWSAFIEQASRGDYLDRTATRYPGLRSRLTRVAELSLGATSRLAARLARDRAELDGLAGTDLGPVRRVVFGEGDTHRGGSSVSRVEFAGGSVMYKPRDSSIDAALRLLVEEILDGFPDAPPPAQRIRVPRVLVRGGYGWSEYIAHRYCADEAELAAFYRNVGHWLAVLRLVGGTDMHAENMIAAGPVPVIVDAETLFDAPAAFPASGRGQAVDVAAAAIRRTVLRTGLLPVRGGGYALGGVDISAVGALPGQQPRVPTPVIADAGTAAARLEVELTEMARASNHPSARPVLSAYWDRVLAGFKEMSGFLRGLDDGPGGVDRLLRRFDGVEARRILRPTQAYVDIARMLWHPASLHDEAAALERGRDILRRNAAALPGAPTEPETIDAEIADLLTGDVPLFGFTVDDAAIAATVEDWRGADLPFEESIVQDALVGAYLNERTLPARVRAATPRPDGRDREARRRALAAAMTRRLCDGAVCGGDGTVTWISPVFTPVGWSIRVLPADLYSGQGGVALALAAYVARTAEGRAEPVDRAARYLEGALRVLVATEDSTPQPSAGAFSGAASQIWTWLALHRVSGRARFLDRAVRRAAAMEADRERLIDQDREIDLLNGAAGAVVPLLALAEATGDARWLESAASIGDRLESSAVRDEAGARWVTRLNPEGIGGFAHGAAGLGWVLARLALSGAGTPGRRASWQAGADEAFAYQESLYRPEQGNWLDMRIGGEEDFFTSWCHGSTGVGLGMLDLYRRTGDAHALDTALRAGRACVAEGFGWSHTLCHGDLGLWEFLVSLEQTRPGWGGPSREELDAELLTGLERRGPVGGLAREAFSPSLMSGLAGVVYTLLRMQNDHGLPTPLLLD